MILLNTVMCVFSWLAVRAELESSIGRVHVLHVGTENVSHTYALGIGLNNSESRGKYNKRVGSQTVSNKTMEEIRMSCGRMASEAAWESLSRVISSSKRKIPNNHKHQSIETTGRVSRYQILLGGFQYNSSPLACNNT